MPWTVCVVLLMPGAVMLALIVAVFLRPDVGKALAEVLTASAEPLRSITPWRCRDRALLPGESQK